MTDRDGQPLFTGGELAAAAWAVAMLISTVVFAWYGVDGIPGRSRTVVSVVDAWNGLSVLPWLMLVTTGLAVASVLLHLTQRVHGARTDTSLLVAVVATVTLGGLVYRVLINPPEAHAIVDQKLGALIGLTCALGTAACAWRWVRNVRSRRPALSHRTGTRRARPASTAGPSPAAGSAPPAGPSPAAGSVPGARPSQGT